MEGESPTFSIIKSNELLDILNNINLATQCTMEANETQLPFLDIMINKEEKRYLLIFIENQRKDMSLSNQTTLSIP